MTRRVLFLLLLLCGEAQATAPTLPQLTVTTTDPTVLGSYRRTVDCTASAGNAAAQATCLSAAVADAEYGDLIETEPGATLDLTLELGVPGGTLLVGGSAGVSAISGSSGAHALAGSSGVSATSGTGAVNNYVTIRPTGFDAAVTIGTRAFSSDAASMTTLRANSEPAAGQSASTITAAVGAQYWWLSGLEVIPKAGDLVGTIINLSPADNGDDPANQLSHVILDRVYVHGDLSGSNGGPGAVRGVLLNGSYTGVIHSTIDDFKTTDPQGDSQAISMANGSGPVIIDNNLLGATSENVLFETPTSERLTHDPAGSGRSVTYHAGTPNTVVLNTQPRYNAIGKPFNFDATPASTATVTAVSAPSGGFYTLTLSGALSGVADGTTGLAFITYLNDATYFPADITITRNHFRKKDSWNIVDPTFERNSGGDTGLTALKILASDDTKLEVGSFPTSGDWALGGNSQIYITTNTGGWTAGYAYVVSIDGSGNAQMSRDLGTAGATGGAARKKYAVKNSLEFKSGSRTLVQGNVFDGSWSGGQAYILTFTPRYANSPAGDLTFQYNKVRNAFAIASITASEGVSGCGCPPPWLENHRITIKHNLFENIQTSTTSPYYGPGSTFYMINWVTYPDAGTVNSVAAGEQTMDDFVFDHNTIGGASSEDIDAIVHLGDDNDPTGTTLAKRFIFRNNIVFTGAAPYGALKGYSSSTGTAGLDKHTSTSGADARSVTKNIFFDTALTGGDYDGSTDTGNTWVATASRSSIGFTDYAGGNYTITGANATAATDGTMIGADIAELDIRTAGAVTGVW